MDFHFLKYRKKEKISLGGHCYFIEPVASPDTTGKLVRGTSLLVIKFIPVAFADGNKPVRSTSLPHHKIYRDSLR
jgi:hypothetical protein